MDPFAAYELTRVRLAELRREADRERLIRNATVSARPAPPFRSRGRVRSAVGGGLVRLGLRLAGVQQIEW